MEKQGGQLLEKPGKSWKMEGCPGKPGKRLFLVKNP